MSIPPIRTRPPWEDKFREPSLADLLSGLTEDQALQVAEEARQKLLGFPKVKESVQWLGLPWRWTIAYSCDPDPTRAWVYVVPNPAKLQVCVPLVVPMVQVLPLRRLKKYIRDGIVYSKFVGGVYWPSWDLTSKQQLDEIIDLCHRKYKYIFSSAEALSVS